MKKTFAVLLLFAIFCCSGCAALQRRNCEDDVERIILADKPQNVKSVIFLVNQNTGDLACCRDTAMGTAEECAAALEKECFKRVEDIPYRTAKYDFLNAGTYPTRRWRENEQNPRW